ncbi:DNA cytosine methyltransferase [Pontiellaceae bacterium B1224]|nr:DNA cytosine methyltransferase [Pontiellaceae bacterium B1224]
MNKATETPAIPIIDLFAGPGGLGEGFSRYPISKKKRFKIAVSIEKDRFAHQTLTLRAFYRQFPEGEVPDEYYQYLRNEITKDDLFGAYSSEADAAKKEALQLTLGEDDPHKIIGSRIKGSKHWVLIGGPPCQAYSLVGRSKMLGNIKREKGESQEDYEVRRSELFSNDPRHSLYLEYLEIIAQHWPSIFVMENVRGILSSKQNGELIFPKILKDLSDPSKRHAKSKRSFGYKIFSLTTFSEGGITDLKPSDYLIHSEKYGIPQARHRVILLGIRDDLNVEDIPLLQPAAPKSVEETIGQFPKLTPGLSKGDEESPYAALFKLKETSLLNGEDNATFGKLTSKKLGDLLGHVRKREARGSRFVPFEKLSDDGWYYDSCLRGVCNHETRSHIKEDLWRYFFASNYADANKCSPQLRDFPEVLLPNHRNVKEAISGQKFGDRFRVQIAGKPSTTVTSHISKDGHYFIHYDPKQYRSLTVREAARLQTFPDNYFFEGPRTAQYHQVGNAVPPLLAYKIAEIVSDIMESITKKGP